MTGRRRLLRSPSDQELLHPLQHQLAALVGDGAVQGDNAGAAPRRELGDFERGLYDFIEKKYGSIFETLRTKKALDDKTEADLKKALDEYKTAFGAGPANEKK